MTSKLREVPTRRVRFEYPLDEMGRLFADGDIVMSHVLATLSSMFPDGEAFFVRSVRNFGSEITDPVLQEQVKGFIRQEAIHGREHRRFNDKLAELGYPTKRIERSTDRLIRFRERVQSDRSNLAVTAALEHYTATLAEILLTSTQAQQQLGHAEVRSLFLWHSLEESEHKAVAFDVYRQVGGKEWVRKLIMNTMTFGFIGGVAGWSAISIIAAKEDRSETWKSCKRLRESPILNRKTWRTLRDYNRSNFHPDDHGSAELIDEWRDELFGPDGRLASRLG